MDEKSSFYRRLVEVVDRSIENWGQDSIASRFGGCVGAKKELSSTPPSWRFIFDISSLKYASLTLGVVQR
jgi:hypothetical protein